jgi:hypothetical protein
VWRQEPMPGIRAKGEQLRKLRSLIMLAPASQVWVEIGAGSVKEWILMQSLALVNLESCESAPKLPFSA